MTSTFDEEILVLMHACLLGRTDIAQQAISSLKTIVGDDEEVISVISMCREYKIDQENSGIGTNYF